jgi:hypothetical protein
MIYLLIGIFLLMLGVGVIAFVQKKRGGNPTEVAINPDIECCGAHDVCETDSLLNSNADIVYFDDEELDRFKGQSNALYSDTELEEFQEVLMTMNEVEVAGWLRSLNLRQIELPSLLKEQALMIVDEVRQLRRLSIDEKVTE